MEEQPEDLFSRESEPGVSTSQELMGLRARLAARPDPSAVQTGRPFLIRAGLSLLLVIGVIGVVTWAWRDGPPEAAAPPPAASANAVQPPPPPPDPPPAVATAPPPETTTSPAPVPIIKKPAAPPLFRPVVAATNSVPPPTVVEPPVAKEYVVTAADRRGVEGVVERYRDALTRLDAAAVRAVWPSANARDLAREFGQLQEQQVEFHSCDLDIKETIAAATCTGVVGYVQKVGTGSPRFDDRRWAFTLKRAGSDWAIQDVVIR